MPVNQEPKSQAEFAEAYFAYRLVRTPRTPRRTAYVLLGLFFLILGMSFLPWQQNIQSIGEVTAFLPQQRPQTVPSNIDAQIAEWYVQEGQYVRAGDSLLRLVEVKDKYLDPQFLLRLNEMLAAKRGSISANEQKRQALIAQYEALVLARDYKLAQARNKLEQARLKVLSDSAAVQAAETALSIATSQVERQRQLFAQGLVSRTELEAREMKYQEAVAKRVEALNKLGATRQEYATARLELESIQADYADKLSKALSEQNGTLAYINDAQGEMVKLMNELANMEARQQFHVVRAPQDGYVVQASRRGVGETVKPGEAILSIVPADADLAAEVYIRDTDVPLLRVGDHVRIQFDGWPALQVSGWPVVSVGTFGGLVTVIDRVATRGDQYRVLIRPDTTDEPWPEQLRMGSGVYAWAMLDDVPIWYEIWRQLNGFPPARREAPTTGNYGGASYGGNGSGSYGGNYGGGNYGGSSDY